MAGPRPEGADTEEEAATTRQRCEAFEQHLRHKYLNLLERKDEAARQLESAQVQIGETLKAHDEWRQQLAQKHASCLEETAQAAKSIVLQHEQSVRLSVWNEYISTISKVEPDLKKSGKAVSVGLVDMFFPGILPQKHRTRPQDMPEYGTWEFLASKNRNELSDRFKMFEPLVEPVLEPFVSGLTEPLADVYQTLQTRVIAAVAITAAISFGMGWAFGRRFGRGGASRDG